MTKLSQARSTLPLALLAASLLVAAAPLAAQTPDTVQSVRIAVVDPQTGDELAILAPGQEINLSPGEELMLRLFEPNPDRRHDRRPLSATFGFGPTETPLQIVRTSPERGEVVVRLAADTPVGQRWHVGYKLADRLVLGSGAQQLGRVLVKVTSPGVASVTGRSYYPYGQATTRPTGSVVDVLYRAILLRDPDPGAQGYVDDVYRHGYDAVLRVAVDIANSQESRIKLHEQGVTNAQRLDALYGQLLGWSRSDVSREQWYRDLSELDRGNLAGVVDSMVRSEQFRSRFGF
jgi:hypothetical protein